MALSSRPSTRSTTTHSPRTQRTSTPAVKAKPAISSKASHSTAKAKDMSRAKIRLGWALIIAMIVSPILFGALFNYPRKVFNLSGKDPGFVVLEHVVSDLMDNTKAQISLSIETPDQSAAQTIRDYTPKLRSSMFLIMASFKSDELLTQTGKLKLSYKLKEAFKNDVGQSNAALVEDIHYTEFLIGD